MPHYCHHCGKEVSIGELVGRSETCPHCDSDLHCCLNCLFYDPKAYNECRESNAERVLEKGRSNFCDYFSFAENKGLAKESGANSAKEKLENLFKKN